MSCCPKTPLLAVALSLAYLAVPVHALDLTPILGMGFNIGGDKLATVVFVGGGTESIDANGGVFFQGGAFLPLNAAKTLGLQATVGYQSDSVQASNGSLEFTTYPIEVVGYYQFSKVRLTGGLVHQLSPELDGDGFAAPLNFNLDDATGLVAQAEWRLSDRGSIGARFTAIEYDGSGLLAPVDGNSAGVVGQFAF